jgi:hypothetical protein
MNALAFQQNTLSLVIRATFGEGDHPVRIDNAVPWDRKAGREVVERISHKAGASHKPGQRGDAAIGRDPTARDLADDPPDIFVSDLHCVLHLAANLAIPLASE